MNVFLNRRGETLLETVIAISMIMVILAPTVMVMTSSSRNTDYNRSDTVAVPLAEQAMELLRNLRDTNFNQSPLALQRDCWNVFPPPAQSGTDPAAYCADSANKIAPGSYIIDSSNPSQILLQKIADVSSPMALENPDAAYELKEDKSTAVECDAVNPVAGCHIHYRDDTHLYTHSPGIPSGFFRELLIEYADLNPALSDGDDVMRITSTVAFRAGFRWRSVKSATFLSRIP